MKNTNNELMVERIDWLANTNKVAALHCLETAKASIEEIIMGIQAGHAYHGGIHNVLTQLGLAENNMAKCQSMGEAARWVALAQEEE